jgi:thioredoxin-related protein
MRKITVLALIAAIAMMGFAAQFEQAVFAPSATQVSAMPETTVAAAPASELKWYTWAEATELQKTKPKKMLIDVYTDWCGWCKRMDKNTFGDAKVSAYLTDNFYPVKLDAEQKEDIIFGRDTFKFVESQPGTGKGFHTLAYALLDGRMGYPTVVYLDETYQRISISPGYKEVPDMMTELEFIKDEHYKTKTLDQFKGK